MTYTKDIANALITYCRNENYTYEFFEEKNILRMKFNMEGKLQHLIYYYHIFDNYFTCYTKIPLSADMDALPAIAEFLTRANYGLLHGNFELDFNDGEIRYKYTVMCENSMPSDEDFEKSIIIPLQMFNRYGNGLLKVMFGMATAKDAIDEIEG